MASAPTHVQVRGDKARRQPVCDLNAPNHSVVAWFTGYFRTSGGIQIATTVMPSRNPSFLDNGVPEYLAEVAMAAV
jgi:hypothetical protein